MSWLAHLVLFRSVMLEMSESLVRFVDGAGGALSLIEFRVPADCRVLDSLVGTLAAIGVQILHIRVKRKRDHVEHRLHVAECDGSDVRAPHRAEVQHTLLELVEGALARVRRPLSP